MSQKQPNDPLPAGSPRPMPPPAPPRNISPRTKMMKLSCAIRKLAIECKRLSSEVEDILAQGDLECANRDLLDVVNSINRGVAYYDSLRIK